MTWTTAMRMHSALTQREVSPAPATLATLEMVSTVQVRYSFISIQDNIFGMNKIFRLIHSFYTMYMYTCSTAAYILQISMSVNWTYIHAVTMPTAVTQMVASTAHVGKASKEMGSTVQVCTISILHKHSCVLKWWHILLQTFRSVKEGWMIVTQMQIAQTLSEVTFVHATLDLLEMVISVKVSNENFILIMQHCTVGHFSIWL